MGLRESCKSLSTNRVAGHMVVPRAATVTAIDQVTTARLPRAAFIKLLRGEPKIASSVLRGLVRTMRDIEATAPPASSGPAAATATSR
jgi:CRP-like cAMP-binding protein